MVIDLYGLSEDQVRQRFPAVFQHILLHVKPEREQNNRDAYREQHGGFSASRAREFRAGACGLARYIATMETGKHRPFMFLACRGAA